MYSAIYFITKKKKKNVLKLNAQIIIWFSNLKYKMNFIDFYIFILIINVNVNVTGILYIYYINIYNIDLNILTHEKILCIICAIVTIMFMKNVYLMDVK